MTKPGRNGTGLVLGKFMPLHRGHMHLVEFAQNYVEDLTVVVGTLADEPIDGGLRYQWMKAMYPHLRVVHLTDDNPQDPSEHPRFWDIWRSSLNRVLPYSPDYVFASDDYGARLAEELDATFIQVDPDRSVVPISGSAIRNDPMANWEFLPNCVRPHFVKRVCVFGPESTGKTTLATDLAAHFGTVMVPEYARAYLEARGGEVALEDMEPIARGQAALEDEFAQNANKLLVCDTDLLTTVIWSRVLFGECPPWILRQALERRYDLYLVTDVDVPWVEDSVRYLRDERQSFLDKCTALLNEYQRPYLCVTGSRKERITQASEALDALIR